MNKSKIQQVIDNAGLSLIYTFVPFSLSRNKDEKRLSMNYQVTVMLNGRKIFTTDYSMGVGHIPNYTHTEKAWAYKNAVKQTCETGTSYLLPKGQVANNRGITIWPQDLDAWYCLITDTNVLHYSSFEQWADDFGYNSDSRKAEKIYQECLKQSLTLQSMLGYQVLAELQELFTDY